LSWVKISSRHHVRILGYCLTPNYFHFLIAQQELSISMAPQSPSTRQTRYCNRRCHRGPRIQTEVRERFVSVVTRIMFCPEILAARFWGAHPGAVTQRNRRCESELKTHPPLENGLLGLLRKNGKSSNSQTGHISTLLAGRVRGPVRRRNFRSAHPEPLPRKCPMENDVEHSSEKNQPRGLLPVT
jgi:hypothetical protein